TRRARPRPRLDCRATHGRTSDRALPGQRCYIHEVRYDLFFAARAAIPTLRRILDYFAQRPHYTIENHRASYLNPLTGVDFSFDLQTGTGEYIASFHLEYLRSHVFALEARPEVVAFIEAFDLSLYDPQEGSVHPDALEPEALIRGYNQGNARAHQRHFREAEIFTVAYSLES